LLEIDTLRMDRDAAVALFEREILPELRSQPGYAGVLVMSTPDGAGALLSFWESAEAADVATPTGFYPEVLERYMTIFKAPPGRERYELSFAEVPAQLPH
jgi:hypothetical protein